MKSVDKKNIKRHNGMLPDREEPATRKEFGAVQTVKEIARIFKGKK